MKRLALVLLALPAAGCVRVSGYAARDLDYEVLDARGKPLEEWWVLSWRKERTCFCGFWMDLHGLSMWPECTRTSHVQLRRMTPADRTIHWPGSYTRYVNWGFLILPPGSACHAFSELRLFARGHPWGWDYAKGGDFPWEAVHDP